MTDENAAGDDAVPTWGTLFDRAAAFDRTEDDVRETLAAVRGADD